MGQHGLVQAPRDDLRSRQASPSRSTAIGERARTGGTVADRQAVLALQRTAGNRATVAAMRQTRTGARAANPTLARCQGACKCGGACRKPGDDDELTVEMGRHLQRAAAGRHAGNGVMALSQGAVSPHAAPALPRPLARSPYVARQGGRRLMRAKNDMVAYTGGQTGTILVFGGGSFMYACPAVSGHPGTDEWEVGAGPIPTHTYFMHPQRTRRPVTKIEPGVCGAGGLDSGYQEVQSTDLFECTGAHYCHIPCVVGTRTTTCGSPQDCWGSQRITIEGGVSVPIPGTGRHSERGGFFLHAGNRADPVSSGCLKTLNEDVFGYVRTLSGPKGAGGRVPLCVGTACPDWVQALFPFAPVLSTVIQVLT
jgi:hypothetical protein